VYGEQRLPPNKTMQPTACSAANLGYFPGFGCAERRLMGNPLAGSRKVHAYRLLPV